MPGKQKDIAAELLAELEQVPLVADDVEIEKVASEVEDDVSSPSGKRQVFQLTGLSQKSRFYGKTFAELSEQDQAPAGCTKTSREGCVDGHPQS